jgi:hypothetical protein
VTTARREQAKALFTELTSLLHEIQETEAADPVQDASDGTGLSALLGSLHSLREFCSARALLYARVADLLGQQEALWSSEEKGGARRYHGNRRAAGRESDD